MMKKSYMQSADALGSTVELRLLTSNQLLAEEWFVKLWDIIHKSEREFSRFDKESDLSQFNYRAGERVPVSQAFEALLRKAKEFSEITNGVFNIFMLPNLQQAGYVHSMTDTKTSPNYSMRESADWRLLEIGSGWARIPKNTAIDLGGIGKGFLADELGSILKDNIPDYCLSLGGDLRIGGKDVDGDWRIHIDSPQKNTEPQIYYKSAAQTWGIATSGTVREKSHHRQNHLVNPKTGVPITSDAICTVVAKSATTADVLASCILISGKDLAIDLFHRGIVTAVIIQDTNGTHFSLGEGFFTIKDEVECSNYLPNYA